MAIESLAAEYVFHKIAALSALAGPLSNAAATMRAWLTTAHGFMDRWLTA